MCLNLSTFLSRPLASSWIVATHLALIGATSHATAKCELQKLIPPAPAADDNFGFSVAIDSDTALIGAYLDDDAAPDAGAAYILQRANPSDPWMQVAKLVADDAESDERFGFSVDLAGDFALIGAQLDDANGAASGSAYIFQRNAGGEDQWGQVTKLTASDGASGDLFGGSVAITDDFALISAAGETSATGAAYVYQKLAPDLWVEIEKLTATGGEVGDNFGFSVALDAGTAIIGAYLDDDNGPSSGTAYIFTQSADWDQTSNLTASDADTADWFGSAVALQGNTAIIGARRDDDNGSNSGAAYIFERMPQNPDGPWTEVTKLLASDGEAGDQFATSVAIDNDTALIGAPLDDDGGSSTGSAYIFTQSTSKPPLWMQLAKLTASDAEAVDQFAIAVTVSGDTALVGAPLANATGENSGAAYLFAAGGKDCNTNGQVDQCDIATGSSSDDNQNGIPDECEGPPGDLTGDNIINSQDLGILLGNWGPCPPDSNCPGDLNDDGIVDGNDLGILLGGWE